MTLLGRAAKWCVAIVTVGTLAGLFAGAASGQTALDLARKGPHIGRADEAVVGVEVVDEPAVFSAHGSRVEGGTVARRSSGLLVRCDGFIIAPSGVFGHPARPAKVRRRVRVTLNPGTDHARHVVLSLPARITPGIGYTLLKLDDFHAPAARLRLPDALKSGDEEFLVWTPWDERTQRFGPVQRRSVMMEVVPRQPDMPERLSFAAAAERAPAGACVAMADGSAVGIISSVSGGTSGCLTFTSFGRLSNCVAPSSGKPAEAATVEKADKTSAEPAGETPMVSIPGGPVLLPNAILLAHPDLNGARWVCVAPFDMDKYEVTNQQYLEFWKSLPEEVRKDKQRAPLYYPLGWAADGEPFPEKLASLPVLGVAYDGALAYARWKGKRLPTPYEWCLAALGPDGDTKMPEWAQKYIAEVNTRWNTLWREHSAKHFPFNDDGEMKYMYGPSQVFPWFFHRARSKYALMEAKWSKDLVESAFNALMTEWTRPNHVVEAGTRSYDVSPYGVADAVLNAAEIVVPPPGQMPSGSATVYVQVDWANPELIRTAAWTKIKPQGHWWNYLHEVATHPVSPPLLSRYIGHIGTAKHPPDWFRYCVIASTLYEIADLIRPITTWNAGLVNTRVVRHSFPYIAFNGEVFPPEPIEFAGSYPIWAGIPKWFEPEMGRPVAISDEDLNGRMGERWSGGSFGREELWLFPGGFRCVR